jgi:Ni,Fe-hydrogenase maturation factor
MGSPILVIGVGNAFRGDDAVGLIVARRLRRSGAKGLTVIEESGWRGR